MHRSLFILHYLFFSGLGASGVVEGLIFIEESNLAKVSESAAKGNRNILVTNTNKGKGGSVDKKSDNVRGVLDGLNPRLTLLKSNYFLDYTKILLK